MKMESATTWAAILVTISAGLELLQLPITVWRGVERDWPASIWLSVGFESVGALALSGGLAWFLWTLRSRQSERTG